MKLAARRGPGARRRQTGKPNFVLMISDDQPRRRSHNSTVTPNIFNRIVDAGIDYELGYANTPVCSPARAAFWSGQYQHNHGVVQTGVQSYSQTKTEGVFANSVVKRLDDAGYRCGHFGKLQNGYEDAMTEIPAGFDITAWFASGTIFGTDFTAETTNTFNRYGTITNYPQPPNYTSDLIADEVEAFFANHASRTDPFYITLAFHDPHRPYWPSPASEHDFDAVVLEEYPSMSLTASEYTAQRNAFEGKLEETRDMDDAIERVFVSLAANGFSVGPGGDTYVIFVADNGYMFGEHDITLKNWEWEESVNVPFCAVGPTISSGVTSRALVGHVDVAPTLLDLAGLSWSDMDGRSLVPTFDGTIPGTWRQHILLESATIGEGQASSDKWAELRKEEYAYMWRYNQNQGAQFDLYDMTTLDADAADTYQTADLIGTAEASSFTSTYQPILNSLRTCSGSGCRSLEST